MPANNHTSDVTDEQFSQQGERTCRRGAPRTPSHDAPLLYTACVRGAPAPIPRQRSRCRSTERLLSMRLTVKGESACTGAVGSNTCYANTMDSFAQAHGARRQPVPVVSMVCNPEGMPEHGPAFKDIGRVGGSHGNQAGDDATDGVQLDACAVQCCMVQWLHGAVVAWCHSQCGVSERQGMNTLNRGHC